MGIRIVTINLWGRAGDWPARRSVLRQSLAELRPDLVAFQESFVLPDNDQVAELVDHMNVAHQKSRSPDGGGISIASRFPIAATHELDLHLGIEPREFAAWALMVEVDASEPAVAIKRSGSVSRVPLAMLGSGVP
jgi:endonuclease/exonuclease/phosphatase family metal-dependent hydrolase